MCKLQKEITIILKNEYAKIFPKRMTYIWISRITGIEKTRVFRIFSLNDEMKLSEYERIRKLVIKLKYRDCKILLGANERNHDIRSNT